MRMSAEDATPATESREQPVTTVARVGAAAATPAGDAEAMVAGGVSGAAVIVQGSDVASTTKQAAGAVTTPLLPEEPLQGNDLLEAIKKQVEFYFSRQNLQTDGFLVSQMNAQMCVPVSVIAQFHKIQQLTSDTGLIVESMKDSTVCAVTPDGIKPIIKQERNTIILREIPSETSEEKIREIFTGEDVAPIKNIRSDVGDTWFVTMDSEDDAMSTILALRSKSFEGNPIKARLKSENILRSFFPVPTAAEVQPTAAAAAAAPYGMGGHVGGPGGMPVMPYGMPGMGAPMMNGQPSYGYPGPGTRGMYGRGGNMMMQGPGGMRFGAMQHSGMVHGGAGAGGRGGGMVPPRGVGGMQMGGMGGMHGGHQGHGMGQQQMGIGMNATQLQQQQQQQYQQQSQQQYQQQPQQQPQQQQQQHRQQPQQHQQQQGENRGDKKGSVRDREAMQQGSVPSVGNGPGLGTSHQQPPGSHGQAQRGGEGRGGGGDRPRKGDRASNTLHGRGDAGRGGGGGGGRPRSSGGRDMLSAANFPPLPVVDGVAAAAPASTSRSAAPSTSSLNLEQASASHEGDEAGEENASAVVAAGYPGPFIQYQADEILKIVSTLSPADVAVVPDVDDMGQHALVFEREPNVGLLMRQRSVSIDECREQLRKGRPVHREGVIAGAVDFRSYMYGEGHEPQAGQTSSGGPDSSSSVQLGGHPRGGRGTHCNEGYTGGGGGGGDRKKGDRGRRDRGDRSGRSGSGVRGGDEKAAGGDEKTSRGSRGNKTSSSSSATGAPQAADPEPMGAYAAALLKMPAAVPPPAAQQQQQPSASTKPPTSKSSSGKSGGASSRDRKGDGKTSKDCISGGVLGSSGGASTSSSGGSGGGSSSAAHDDAAGVTAKSAGSAAGSNSGASKNREAGGKERGEGRGNKSGGSTSGGQGGAPRPTRGWEKPDVMQSKRSWGGDSGRGSKANSSAKHTPSAVGGGSDDKKSPSSTGSATVSVSGDEGGDTSSSSPRGGAGGEDSTEGGRHAEKELGDSKEALASASASAGSDGDGVNSSPSANPPAAEASQGEGASVSRWGGKKSFLDVVKTPGNPQPPVNPAVAKPSPQPTNKRAESLKSPGRRGRPDRDNSNVKSPMRGGGARGDRDRGDNKSHHHSNNKDSSRGHMSNGRAGGGGDHRGSGGGPREKGAWA